MERKNWKALSRTVNSWLKASPESARAWFYKGAVLRAAGQESLAAFQKSVGYDPNFEPGRVALCVAQYHAGRELESLICSELIPRGPLLDEYKAATNQQHVYVSGMNPGRKITALDVLIVQKVMGQGK